MYSISIPNPTTLAPYIQIGFITTWESNLILIYWAPEINQVLLLNGMKGWFMQPNARITDSLAQLLNVTAEDIMLDRLFFMKDNQTEVPNNTDVWEVYDHTWSLYAEQRVSLQCTLRLRNTSFLATNAPIKPSPLRVATLKVGPSVGPPGLIKPAPQLPSLSRPLEAPFPYASVEHLDIVSTENFNVANHDLMRSWV